MSISRQNLSAVIVTFNSDKVIYDCVDSIPNEIKIIIVDNSNNNEFKEKIERKYNNVKCILSTENLGVGSGNNLGLKHIKTDYAIILNPDVILEKNTIQEIINQSENINNFAILAPLSIDPKYPNFKLNNKINDKFNDHLPFKVKSVDGYAMVLNLKKINQIENFKNFNYFDENFFMYLENDDLCKRVKKNNEKIFIVPTCKVKHFGAKGVSENYLKEVELSRNWHWSWSNFYFSKKHDGYLYALLKGFPKFLSSIIKCFFTILFLKNINLRFITIEHLVFLMLWLANHHGIDQI